uniref:Uncharacterized protein n=1 Tax=Meloidogyne hapla TaxID=6305 RepID=A0A1I8BU83_MELHA
MILNILIINFIILTIQKFNFVKAASSGFDSVENITTDIFKQAKSSANIEFFIGRVFNGALYDIPSGGPSLESSVDHDGIQNIANANSAGLVTDAYFIPRYAQLNDDIDGQVIVNYTLNALNNANLPLKNIWVVISSKVRSGWSTDSTTNVECLNRILTQFKNNIDNVGIMTSQDALTVITGDNGDISASKPFATLLWWKNCEGNGTFTSFGGWQTPAIIQNSCGKENFGIEKVNMDVKN